MPSVHGSSDIGRRTFVGVAGAVGLFPAAIRGQIRGRDSGVALVIGNAAYRGETRLPNVKRDVRDIARCFQRLGLNTEIFTDLDGRGLRNALARFRPAAAGADLAAFYYAGHGVSWEKQNYLVPVDADLATPEEIGSLVPVECVTRAARGAAASLMIFDSCRSNPAGGSRPHAAESPASFSVAAGKATEEGAGALTLYPTAPGRVALDGPPGENSPFAAALLRRLSSGAVDLPSLPSILRRDLLVATAGRQVVWDSSSFPGPFRMGAGRPSALEAIRGSAGIIELPNAYAFARANGLALPEGLVAMRGAAHAEKPGAYFFAIPMARGVMTALVIVLSVAENGVAQLVTAVQGEPGRLWSFVVGNAEGLRLTFQPVYGMPEVVLDWRDQHSLSRLDG